MKILYFDCGMGAAGDMLMASLYALLSTQCERDRFIEKINSIGIPKVSVKAVADTKCGIAGYHMQVHINGSEEESADVYEHAHGHEHHHEHVYEHENMHSHESAHGHAHENECEHIHEHENIHEHAHGNKHQHTSMHEIREITDKLDVSLKVKQDILNIYQMIAEAESRAHGIEVSQVHFHEVGMMDAVADIAGCALLMEHLSPDLVICSPVNVGFGKVQCAHGILPVPAPATAYILEQKVPYYAGKIEGEMTTPTGAAIIKYYTHRFASMPAMNVTATGYGTGKKDFEAANVLRAVFGTGLLVDDSDNGCAHTGKNQEKEYCGASCNGRDTDEVVELACNIDDMTPEELSYASELLLQKGALDIYTCSVGMKKSRQGILLSVLCSKDRKESLAELIFKHTSTIGIREYPCKRMILHRNHSSFCSSLGEISLKHSTGYGSDKIKAEFEDLKKIAEKNNMSVFDVKKRVMAEYNNKDEAKKLPFKLEEKFSKLTEELKKMGKVLVAFSAGVDSTLLLYAAKCALGENVMAVTAKSPLIPDKEISAAMEICGDLGIKHVVHEFDCFSVDGFSDNQKDRCYLCKSRLFAEIRKLAQENDIRYIVEGSNVDDLGDFRPGLKAVREQNIRSPLRDAGLQKKEIREILRCFNFSVWNKPSAACLASRIPYGETITKKRLLQVEQAEEILHERGFCQVRVRLHGNIARVEILPEDFERILNSGNKDEICAAIEKLGFQYVALDLRGYRTGSLNTE